MDGSLPAAGAMSTLQENNSGYCSDLIYLDSCTTAIINDVRGRYGTRAGTVKADL